MEFRIAVIDIKLSQRERRLGGAILGMALALVASVAFADVPPFTAGETLTAAKLNTNFADLEQRLVAQSSDFTDLESRVAALESAIAPFDTGTTSAEFLISSIEYTDVPGLDATVTSDGPVLVAVSLNLNPQGGVKPAAYERWAAVTVTRNGVNLGHPTWGFQVGANSALDNIPTSFTFIDNPGPGAHTYQVQVRNGEAGYQTLLGESSITQTIAAIVL
jgi:hypothetical protein